MNTKNNKILFSIKFSIIIICLYYNGVILSNIVNFIFYINIKNNIKNFETFLKFCDNNIK